jgi:hypothetical protein
LKEEVENARLEVEEKERLAVVELENKLEEKKDEWERKHKIGKYQEEVSKDK